MVEPTMIIYPTIELQNSKPVSLFRGDLDEPQIWHVDPLAKAHEFARAGAKWIHVTDFDAILDQENANYSLIKKMLKEVPASFQIGGGIRSMTRIEEWIAAGAGRVVLGTIAALNPDLVKEAAKFYPDQIVLAVDVIDEHIASHGWREKTAYRAEDFLQLFENDPLAAIIITDIEADLKLNEDSLGRISGLAARAKAPVIARGLTRSLDELSRIRFEPNISGAIVGRALFDRSYSIEEALAVASEAISPTAEFI